MADLFEPFDDGGEAPTGTATAAADQSSQYWLLWLAIGSLVLSILLFVTDARGVQFAGYFLAAPVPFTLVAFFRRHATARLQSAGIGMPEIVSRGSLGLLFAGFACSVLHAYLIARHYA